MCFRLYVSIPVLIFEHAFFMCVLVQANIQDSKEENQNTTGLFLVNQSDTGLLPINPFSKMRILKIAGEIDKKGKNGMTETKVGKRKVRPR